MPKQPRIKSIAYGGYMPEPIVVGFTKINGVLVDEIKVASCEWENHVDFIYEVNGNGQRLVEIINMPVVVEFFKVEND